MRTMLQAAGLPAGTSLERFCVERPDILQSIHAAYIKAGSDILTTCTFGGSKFKLPPDMNVHSFNKAMAMAVRAAAAEAGREGLVAGNIGSCW